MDYIFIFSYKVSMQLSSVVLANDLGERTSIPGRVIPKTQKKKKRYLILSCLKQSIIRYGSRVSGAIQEKESHPPQHLSVVAIEKGAFKWPLTTVGQVMYGQYCMDDI